MFARGRVPRADYPIITVLTLVAIYHLTLLDRGTWSWPDEHLYTDALNAVAHALNLDVAGFCKSLTGFGARPAEATLRLAPAAIQTLFDKLWGVSPFNPQSLRIAAAPNILVSFLLGLVFYKLALLFYEGERWTATWATSVYALLVSSNVYIRHVVPYDTALLFGLLALYWLLNSRMSETSLNKKRWVMAGLLSGVSLLAYPVVFLLYRPAGLAAATFCLICLIGSLRMMAGDGVASENRRWIITGLLAGFGLALYPAYYAFPGALLAIIVLGKTEPPYIGFSWARLRAGALYGWSVLCVVFFYEVVARLGGESYLGCAYRLSRTITQGSFEEAYVFLPRFFVEVERAIGVLLLVLALAYFVTLLWRLGKRVPLSWSQAALALCCMVLTGVYLVYATQSVFLQKMVFTGRYIHFYIPFVVWAAIAALRQIPMTRWRRLAYAGTVLVSVYSFIGFVREYRELAYPINVLYDHGIRWEDVVEENKVYETSVIPGWAYTLPAKGFCGQANYVTEKHERRYLLVNFGHFDMAGGFAPYHPPSDAQLIYKKRHFLVFSASRFEGYTLTRRRDMKERDYHVRIYKLPDAP